MKALVCPNAGNYSRKVIDELTDYLKQYFGAKGLAWMKCVDGKLDGGISKFFDEEVQTNIMSSLEVSENDIIFIIGDKSKIVYNALGALRLKLAKNESLIDESSWAPLWVVDFPLVEF